MKNQNIEMYQVLDTWIKHNKTLSGNYADYTSVPNCICCSWMDIHSDDGSGADKDNPFFYIKPLWWDKDAAIIHIVNDKWTMTIPDGEIIKFDAYHNHALVPIQLAKKVVKLNSVEFDEFEKWDNSVYEGMQSEDVRLVWFWYNINTDEYHTKGYNKIDYSSLYSLILDNFK